MNFPNGFELAVITSSFIERLRLSNFSELQAYAFIEAQSYQTRQIYSIWDSTNPTIIRNNSPASSNVLQNIAISMVIRTLLSGEMGLGRKEINLNVFSKKIDELAEYYLNKTVKKMDSFVEDDQGQEDFTDTEADATKFLRVRYLRSDRTREEGHGDGISRDYIYSLFSAIRNNCKSVQFSEDNMRPSIPSISANDQRAATVCENLGKVMGFVYEDFIIGTHFAPAVFAIAGIFSATELNDDYASLSPTKKGELFQLLAESQNMSESKLELVDFLIPYSDKEQWQLEDLKTVKEKLEKLEYLSEGEDVRECMNETLIEILQPFDEQLRAIHALAKGLKSMCHKGCGETATSPDLYWDTYYKYEVQDTGYQERLQGTLNRAKIIQLMHVEGNTHVQTKAVWLKNWIAKAASDEELRDFLRFVLGVTAIGEDQHIIIKGDNTNSPLPQAQVCFSKLLLSNVASGNQNSHNDFTEEDFIESLKTALTSSKSNQSDRFTRI